MLPLMRITAGKQSFESEQEHQGAKLPPTLSDRQVFSWSRLILFFVVPSVTDVIQAKKEVVQRIVAEQYISFAIIADR